MKRKAAELNLIRHIAKTVESADGVQKAESVRQADQLEEAAGMGGDWFQDRALFLIDDVWARNGIASGGIMGLSKLAQHEGSRIVYTSRGNALRAGKHILFEPSDLSSSCRCNEIGYDQFSEQFLSLWLGVGDDGYIDKNVC